MGSRTTDIFRAPDEDIGIWRFMDFTKFVSMLQNSGLYFVRASHFDDPFEGSFPEAYGAVREAQLRELGLAEERVNWLLSNQSSFRRWNRHWMLVNSWHMNDLESAAMWHLYSKSDDAVAIHSRYSVLRECLPPDIYISTVQYIDYATEEIPDSNVFYPYLHKRRSYSHERELRAIRWETDPWATAGEINMDQVPADSGQWIRVDLNRLIAEVRVAPQSETWFRELVQSVSERYALNKSVIRSSLADEPFF